jgi:hypothetical protein
LKEDGGKKAYLRARVLRRHGRELGEDGKCAGMQIRRGRREGIEAAAGIAAGEAGEVRRRARRQGPPRVRRGA